MDIYSLENDSDDMFLIFKDYVLDDRIDRDIMNTTIISELGGARPITTDPDLFKILMDNMFKKYSNNITKLVNTMYLEYNPLHTKDITRTIDEGIHREVGETEHRYSKGDIDNTDKYDTNTDEDEKGTTTTENTVSAYDSNTYQPKDKSVVTPNTHLDHDVHHEAETTSDIESTVDTDKGTEEQHDRDLTEHIVGKDSMPSYQTLVEQERKLAEFNIYNWIIKQMRHELFLLVY